MTDIIEKQKPEKRTKHMGPHGVGDPDDRSLRKMEKNLLIPQIRRKIVNEEKCPEEIKNYQECVLEVGLLKSPFTCKDFKLKLTDCLEYWNDDLELNRIAREKYLEERTQYRKTGVPSDHIEAYEMYLKQKEEQAQSNEPKL